MTIQPRLRTALAMLIAASLPGFAAAQSPAAGGGRPPAARTAYGLEYGMTLDGSLASRKLALGSRERGFAPGHNEATVAGNIDDHFAGRATAVLHRHDGETELELEEAWFETTALPVGLQVRAGRFLSSIGYLNDLHTHTDDFVERPLLYRAFLGGHYFDDGLRLQWVAPTSLYWRTSLEAFGGRGLVAEPQRERLAGAWTLNTRVGGDIGIEHGWQLGLSYLRNRLDPAAEEAHEDGDGDHRPEDAHDHAHGGARFTGRHLFIVDGTWKWAPDGNNRVRQLRVSAEYARVTDLNEHAGSGDIHEAWYLSTVYRFAPQWEAGLRLDHLKAREPHGDHFHSGRLQEASLSLAWKPTHFSALRLQWTRQRDRQGFDDAGNAVFLQYVMSLGAHGAHAF